MKLKKNQFCEKIKVLSVITILIFSFNLSAKSIKKASKSLTKQCNEYYDTAACVKVDNYCDNGDANACGAMSLYWSKNHDFKKVLSYIDRSCELGDKGSCEVAVKFRKYQKESDAESLALSERKRELLDEARLTEESNRQNAEIGRALSNTAEMFNNTRTTISKPKQTTHCTSSPYKNFKGEIEIRTDCN